MWSQIDAVDPQDGLRLHYDPFALVPVSLPEPHVHFGPGFSLLDHGGFDPGQLPPQQGPPHQREVLRSHQQHLLHADPLPALRVDVVLDQDQVFVRDLPLAAGEMDHSEEAAKVLVLDPPVDGAHHRGVPPPPLLLRLDRDRLVRPGRPGQRGAGQKVPARGTLCSEGSRDTERGSS